MKWERLIILLVEDEENDVYFMERATAETGGGHQIHPVRDGREALSYLCGEGEFEDRVKFPLPNVIITDLKMPFMGGFELLKWLREHPECSVIPTIVFSSSRREEDVREAYRLGASSYITKPTSIVELTAIMRSIFEYWSRCERPRISGSC